MKIFRILLFLSFPLLLHETASAQWLRVTEKGFVAVKDTLQVLPLTKDFYEDYKGSLSYEKKNTKWFEEHKGRFVKPLPDYDSLLVLKKKSGWGCVSFSGRTVLDFLFPTEVTFFRKGTCYGYYASGKGDTYAIDGENNSSGSRFRIVDFSGKEVVSYVMIIDSYRGSHLVYGGEPNQNRLIGDGLDTLLPFRFRCTSWDTKNFGFSEYGYAALKNTDKKCGVIDYTGKVIVPFMYDYIDDPVFRTAQIMQGKKNGLLDSRTLKQVIPIQYDDILHAGNRSLDTLIGAIGRDSSGWDVYDRTFRKTGHYTFQDFGSNLGNARMVEVTENEKSGLYDFLNDRFVYPVIYDEVETRCGKSCDEMMYILYQGNQITIRDLAGKESYYTGQKVEYLSAEFDLMRVSQEKFVLMKELKPFSRDTFCSVKEVWSFSDHSKKYLVCCRNGKYGILSAKGEERVPFEYDYIEKNPFLDNLEFLEAVKGGKLYLFDFDLRPVNREGFEVKPEIYFGKGLKYLAEKSGGQYGVFNLEKKEYEIQPAYENVMFVYRKDHKPVAEYSLIVFGKDKKLFGYDETLVRRFETEGTAVFPGGYTNRCIVFRNGKYLLCDSLGADVSKGRWDTIVPVGNEAAYYMVRVENKYGCINNAGKSVVPPAYDFYCTDWECFSDPSSVLVLYNEKGKGEKCVEIPARGDVLRYGCKE